ncbi:hypothetical protein TrCOL_g3081 [Triparma columacea]|uniref:very-long-chain (3R)-3-hydroxyacyl-CoA dehydratase n=1 Tax=Triparma columacea TaxID=722753 RepID=A0A9W7G6T4_9STRA|nr:hypothetical protein TrCOL_g3081 [Triparma columacea]
MGLKDLYLIGYNAACAAGWAYVLYLATCVVFASGVPCCHHEVLASLETVYLEPPLLKETLIVVQSAALLEIVHAALGLVRSPVVVTAMQVMSRIVALFAVVYSPVSQAHYGSGLMIFGWSLVEVPRYAFYLAALITGDATKGTPYPLFYLRYSLFYVLYPLGITGEMFTFYNTTYDPDFISAFPSFGPYLSWFYLITMLVYIPGGPFMYMNMVGNRKSAFRKRFAKPRPPPKGLVFPTDKKGGKSTSEAGKAALAAAVGAVDKAAAEKILKTKNWRFGYTKHFLTMVELQTKSPSAALKIAKAGLDHMHENFQFIEEDGSSISFKKAMTQKNKAQFETGVIKGTAKKPSPELKVPYKNKTLSGDSLVAQVNKWVSYGTIEQSAGDAILKCISNPKWLDLSDKYFVMLGAGSAMGPFKVLMSLGANIIAIDLDRPGIWKNLINYARDSPGSITFPMKKTQASCKDDDTLFTNCGCNLFTETPLIKDWLLPLYPKKDLVVGSYAYLDGALHVQVSLAMDAICKALSEERKATLAYLCTPTDAHLCSKDASAASLKEYNRFTLGKLFEVFWQVVSRGAFLKKNARKPMTSDDGEEFYMVDGLAVAQGPNYAIAKRLQHWRAIVAREQGSIVSSNIAPATSTASVVHAKTFAMAYEGMPYFAPYEIFEPDTSKAVMLALLTFDFRDKDSAANPSTKLSNPNELFKYGSFNGGCWRCAYTVSSIGEVSVFICLAKWSAPYVGIIGAAGAAFAAKHFGMI